MESVAQLMTADPMVVEGGTPVGECALIMTRHEIRHLPVVDGDGAVTGVVTDWSVFQRGTLMSNDCWVAFEEADQWLLARELSCPVEVRPSPRAPVSEVLRNLLRSFQDVAVVVDGAERPTGIVTEHDAVGLARDLLDDRLWSTELPQHRVDTVPWEAPVRRAIDLMRRHVTRHLLVTRGETLRGVISFRDIVREASIGREARAGELLRRSPPEYAIGAVSLRYAANVMLAQRIGCLPVVDRDLRPLRLLSRADVVRAVISVLDAALEDHRSLAASF